MSASFQGSFWDKLKFNADGLIPAIIQDHRSGRVLMMAWMNKDSLQMSLETGKTHFWSRSRKKLWMKGESSGHTQRIRQIALDCDGDVLLIQVEQVGAACHEGYFSCFYRMADERNQIVILEKRLRKPEEIYGQKRLANNPEKHGKQDAQPKERKDGILGDSKPPPSDGTQSGRSLPLLCGAMFLAFALQCPAVMAQTASGKVSGGWRMPLMENGKLKTLLVGSGAETLADGRFRISEVAIQIYDDQIPPQPRLLIDAPECFFDVAQRQASSAGPISLREAGGNYSIQGLGFSWMQSTSNLSISNNVRTVISRPAADQKPDEPAPDSAPIEVWADRFDYDRTSNVGTYRGQVKAVQGRRFQLICDQVKVLLPDEKRNPRTIEAQGNVQIEFRSEGRTTILVGERARYQTANSGETLQLRGDPFWRADDYEGRGQEIDVENLDANAAFTVRGDAQMSMPAAIASSQEAFAAAPPKIQLRAGSYTYLASESKVLFLGGVQAHSAGKWDVESRRLTALIQPETQTIQRIIAEEQVRVTRSDGDEETQTSGSVITFTPLGPRRSDIVIEGKARFAGRDFSAQGDRIHLRQNDADTVVSAAGNVQVKLLRFTAPGGGILSLAQAPKAASAQKSELLIIANKANLASGTGRFEGDVVVKDAKGTMKSQTLDIVFGKTLRSIQKLKVSGNVQIRHADGKLACRQLIGDFSSDSNVLRRLTASGAVEIQNIHGTAAGRRAIYFADKGCIELSGDAQLRARIAASQGFRNVRATADLLLWDQIQNTFQARGKFRSRTLP